MGYDYDPLEQVGEPVALPGAPILDSGPLGLHGGAGGFGMAWIEADAEGGTDTAEVYFQRIARNGSLAAEPILLSEAGGSAASYPAIASLDGRYVITFVDELEGERSVVARVVDGDDPGPPIKVSQAVTSDYPWMTAAAVDSAGFAVGWHDCHEAFFRAFGTDGTPRADVKQLTNDPYFLEPPALAYGQGAYAMAWADVRDDEDLFFVRVRPDGLKLYGPEVFASAPGRSHHPAMCFDGQAYALAWIDPREGVDLLTLARVSGQGEPLLEPTVVPTSGSPARAAIACLPEGYALVWLQDQVVVVALTDFAGRVTAGPVQASTPGTTAKDFGLAVRPEAFLVVAAEQTLEQDPEGVWGPSAPRWVARVFPR